MSLSPVRLRDGLLQPNRLSGGRIGGGGQSPRDAILATASPATLAYVQAVEAADGNIQLENGVLAAIVEFANYRIPLGGACCLMAGARTLAGALVPMVGAAPTEVNFVTGDYDRTTGLKGDGIGKYLDSNRNNNADPQDSNHQSVFVSTAQSASAVTAYIGAGSGSDNGATHIGVIKNTDQLFIRSRNTGAVNLPGTSTATGLIGLSRGNSSGFTCRVSGGITVSSIVSQVPFNGNVLVFNRITSSPFTDARLSYYSIGPAVDLAAMDTAITTCMSALAAAGI